MKSAEEIVQDALDDFESKVTAEGVSIETIISGLELKLYALRDQADDETEA
jgi:hypothetical protein